jgi:hypothetical protein
VKEGGAIYCTWSETRDFAEICSEGDESFFGVLIINFVLFLAIFLENDLESVGFYFRGFHALPVQAVFKY